VTPSRRNFYISKHHHHHIKVLRCAPVDISMPSASFSILLTTPKASQNPDDLINKTGVKIDKWRGQLRLIVDFSPGCKY
jgi:hypothetical protein